jgi:rhodanese-related sulfurtransferase
MNVLLTSFLFVLLAMTNGCSQTNSFDAMLQDLLNHSVPELKPAECASGSHVFLDARELEEYTVSHLPGAIHVGYDSFKVSALKGLAKDTPLVVYCSVGYRSEKIAEKLISMGYTDVHNLYGGIFLWKDSGNRVVDLRGETQRVHTYTEKWSVWIHNADKVW